ncbi:MAG TPA: hypothetical protein VMB05_03475 [Solirubrobacteraceae bacterium]|nr:hypothetical protein [Solirubrobacteraceae bacterium]
MAVSTALVLLVGLAADAALAPAASAATVPNIAHTTTPATAPPDLQALEQKMLALQITSERFTTSLAVSETPRPKGLGGVGPIFGRASALLSSVSTAAGEIGFAPVRASFQVSVLGEHFNARLIGTTLYIEEPSIARVDGGRPWLELPDEHLGSAVGGGPSAEAEGGLEPAGGFQATVQTIARATSIQEIGRASVNGQAATEFALTIPLERIGKLSHRQLQVLRKLLVPRVHLQLFLAEDGLPLRERVAFTLRHGHGRLIEQSDVLAVDVPVEVQAPPAAETLTDAGLKRLFREQAKHRHKVAARRRGPRHAKKR